MARSIPGTIIAMISALTGSAEELTANQRLERSFEASGLNKMGRLVPPDSNDIAAAILSRIEHSAFASVTTPDGTVIAGRSVADQLEWMTGTKLTKKQKHDVIELFDKRRNRTTRAAAAYCALSTDPAVSDEEFVRAGMRLNLRIRDSLGDYQLLKLLLSAETVNALHDREQKLSTQLVEEKRDTADLNFMLDIADVYRASHASGCIRQMHHLRRAIPYFRD